MHIPILVVVLVALAGLWVGACLAFLGTLLFGTLTAVRFAKLYVSEREDDDLPHGPGCCCDIEQDELDRRAVRDLLGISSRIYVDETAGRRMRADQRAELDRALEAAEERFHEWVDDGKGAAVDTPSENAGAVL
ncbi:MAG: hypothetical protein ACRDVE_05325 [Actinocrinis sp.]